MTIGTGWVEGSWINTSWALLAWQLDPVTGIVSVVEAVDTLAASGGVLISGTAAIIEIDDTLSANDIALITETIEARLNINTTVTVSSNVFRTIQESLEL